MVTDEIGTIKISFFTCVIISTLAVIPGLNGFFIPSFSIKSLNDSFKTLILTLNSVTASGDGFGFAVLAISVTIPVNILLKVV